MRQIKACQAVLSGTLQQTTDCRTAARQQVAKLFSPRGIRVIKGLRMGSRRQTVLARCARNKEHYFGSPLAGRQARTKQHTKPSNSTEPSAASPLLVFKQVLFRLIVVYIVLVCQFSVCSTSQLTGMSERSRTVLVVGHPHVRRLGEFVRKYDRDNGSHATAYPFDVALNFKASRAFVIFRGLGGLKVDGLISPSVLQEVETHRP